MGWRMRKLPWLAGTALQCPSRRACESVERRAAVIRGVSQQRRPTRGLFQQRSIAQAAGGSGGRCCAASQRTVDSARGRWRGAGVCRLVWRNRAVGDWAAERRGLSSPSLGTGMQRQRRAAGGVHAHDRSCRRVRAAGAERR
jgi:hypothetical protein